MKDNFMCFQKSFFAIILALAIFFVSCGEIADPLAPVSSEIPSSASSAISSPDEGDFLPMLSEEESRTQFGWDSYSLFYGEYLYYIGRNGKGPGTYMKKNVRTGECLPLCADPVCTHRAGSDCPFAQLYTASLFHARFTRDGRISYIYYIEDNSENAEAPQKAHFCSYDLVTMDYTELFTETASGYSDFSVAENGDVYFKYQLLKDANDPLCDQYDYYLKKYNPKTKSNETVMIYGSGKRRAQGMPYFFKEDGAGRYWFHRSITGEGKLVDQYYYRLPGDETEYAVTEVPYQSRFFIYGDFCYYLQFDFGTVDREGCRLCQKSIVTGEEILLEEAVTTCIFDGGDRCYFFRYDPEIYKVMREHINASIPVSNTRAHNGTLYALHFETGELSEHTISNSHYVAENAVLHRGRLYCTGIYLRDEKIWGGTQSRFTVDLRSGNVRDGIPSEGTGINIFS